MTLVGAVTLRVAGRDVRVTGGPFSALPEGAFGLCLEARDARVGQAALRLDIVDFGVPEEAALRAVLARLLAEMRARPDGAFHIGCRAGLGRTGLVLACLALMNGVEGDVVTWVREHYDPRAVETEEQEDFVRRFAAA